MMSCPRRAAPGLRSRLVLVTAVFAVLCLALTPWPSGARAATVIASDDFESGDLAGGTGWLDDWQVSSLSDVQVSTDGSPQSGVWHLRVRGDGAQAHRAADVTAYTALRVKFWAKTSGDDDDGAPARAEVSADGATWTLLKLWDHDEEGQGWTTYDFPAQASASGQLFLRFSLGSGDDDERTLFVDGVSIDDAAANEDGGRPPAGDIVLDSNFSDWTGRASLSDPFGDSAKGPRRDLHELYWANNPDQEVNYHMVRRHASDGQPYNGSNGQPKHVTYLLYVDTNNNGNFRESTDRIVQVSYEPKHTQGVVRVRVRKASDFHLISDTGKRDWGETEGEGGLRAEFAVSWADLGISFGAVVRMYLESHDGSAASRALHDRLPDGSADIQWSPASVLGPLLLGVAFALGVLAVWYFRGRYAWRRG